MAQRLVTFSRCVGDFDYVLDERAMRLVHLAWEQGEKGE
jgi:hypothetical protein